MQIELHPSFIAELHIIMIRQQQATSTSNMFAVKRSKSAAAASCN